jgi:hypothetical protein
LSTNSGKNRKFRAINTLNQKLATNSGKTLKILLTNYSLFHIFNLSQSEFLSLTGTVGGAFGDQELTI